MRSRGLTLIEIIVIVFVVVLVTLVVLVQAGGRSGSRVDPTAAEIKQLEGQLRLFRLDYDRYPESLQDLVRRPSYCDPGKWPVGGYFQEVPVDAWGRPFHYSVPGKRGDFDIVSWGEDGKPGGEGVDADLWNHPLRQ